jgi:hypothetical protein
MASSSAKSFSTMRPAHSPNISATISVENDDVICPCNLSVHHLGEEIARTPLDQQDAPLLQVVCLYSVARSFTVLIGKKQRTPKVHASRSHACQRCETQWNRNAVTSMHGSSARGPAVPSMHGSSERGPAVPSYPTTSTLPTGSIHPVGRPVLRLADTRVGSIFSVATWFTVTSEKVMTRKECHRSHACKSFKRAGVSTNDILECKIFFIPKLSTGTAVATR